MVTLLLLSSMKTHLTAEPLARNVADSAGVPPDAQLLLKGVASRRLQTPPSRLWINTQTTSIIAKHEHSYLVEFDRDKWRFTTLGDAAHSIASKSIQYDGNKIYSFNGINNIAVCELGSYGAGFAFDLRIIGITDSYMTTETPQDYESPDPNVWDVKLAGQELINGKTCWHVIATVKSGSEAEATRQWWIDKQNNFSVYRFETKSRAGHNVVESRYVDGYSWLPSFIRERDYNSSGKLITDFSCIITNVNSDVHFHENMWTLAGMVRPTNQLTVIDQDAQKIIGFWDGTRIRPSSEPLIIKSSPPIIPPPTSPTRLIVICLLVILFIAPLIALITLNAKRNIS